MKDFDKYKQRPGPLIYSVYHAKLDARRAAGEALDKLTGLKDAVRAFH